MLARELRTDKEKRLYQIARVISIILWILTAVSIFGAIYGVLIAAAIAAGQALFLAHVTGNGVRIGPTQMPELWRRVEAASQKLGMAKPPEAYVMQAGGVLNAFATHFFARQFIIIYSSLVDTCEASRPSLEDHNSRATELDFVIAHELGHIACGHLNWLLLPARIIPLLGSAYSRACEYTCDACGHAVVDDLEISSRALAILAGGRVVGSLMSLDAFVEQRSTTGTFWMAVYELNASHPYLSKRVAALREKAQTGAAPVFARNRASYPLAPFFGIFVGGASAGALMVVMMIGVMAAVAIPAFSKYVERSKAIAAKSQARSKALSAGENPVEVPEGMVGGEDYRWQMALPGPGWSLLDRDVARKQNGAVDQWVTNPVKDAHIMVIGETLTGAAPDIDQLAQTIFAGTQKNSKHYKLIDKKTLYDGRGRLMHTRGLINGTDIEYYFAVLVTGTEVYQVVAFAAAGNFASVKNEMMSAILTFKPLAAAPHAAP